MAKKTGVRTVWKKVFKQTRDGAHILSQRSLDEDAEATISASRLSGDREHHNSLAVNHVRSPPPRDGSPFFGSTSAKNEAVADPVDDSRSVTSTCTPPSPISSREALTPQNNSTSSLFNENGYPNSFFDASTVTPTKEPQYYSPVPSPTSVLANISKEPFGEVRDMPPSGCDEHVTALVVYGDLPDAPNMNSSKRSRESRMVLYDKSQKQSLSHEIEKEQGSSTLTNYDCTSEQIEEGVRRMAQDVGEVFSAANWWSYSWDPLRYSDFDDNLSVTLNEEVKNEANPSFLALKKDTEKNEFPKPAKRVTQASQRLELIALTPSPTPDTADKDFIGLDSVSRTFSNDESYEGSDSMSYQSDFESIGEVTIDSETNRLLAAHKQCLTNRTAANLKLPKGCRANGCEPKKSSLRASCKKVETSKSRKKKEKKLSWYDDEENLHKPFTLRTDDSFDLLSHSKRRGFSRYRVAEKFLPLAATIEGFLEKMVCGTEQD